MSEENTSQDNTEDVQETTDAPNIGEPAEEVEDKGPAPIYEETEEDKANKETEEDPEEPETDEADDKSDDDEETDTEDSEDPEEKKEAKADYDSLEKPEDSQLSDDDLERILESSKKEGLSKEAAQKRVEEASSLLKSFSDRTQQTHQAMVEQWAKDSKADKEIGGEKYKESVELARRTVHKFGTKDFLKSLNETGFGNHPEVIRTFARIGRQMADDSLVTDGSTTVHQSKNLADVFYGSETQT